MMSQFPTLHHDDCILCIHENIVHCNQRLEANTSQSVDRIYLVTTIVGH